MAQVYRFILKQGANKYLAGLPLRSNFLKGCKLTNLFVFASHLFSYSNPFTRTGSYIMQAMELKGRIVIYSIVGCPHCMKAKNTLQQYELPYTDVLLDHFPQCRGYVKERSGRSTVPQIFFNNIYVGGNDDLQKKVQSKEEFDKLIAEVKNNPPPDDSPEVPDPSTAVNTGGLDFSCEPDEYALLITAVRESGIIKTQKTGILSREKSAFTGRDFVDWVVKSKEIERDHGIEIGQAMVDNHFAHEVNDENVFKDDKTVYRLVEDDEIEALNSKYSSQCPPRPVNDLGEAIRKLILKIYNAFLSKDGKKVNYKGIGGSTEFDVYRKLTGELVRLQVENASREEKVAFFINIYNALVIHANIERGPATNIWKRYKFFYTMRYLIGGYAYSLQDIENGVLRANRKGVGMLSKPFSSTDPRMSVALETPEPLIHFALVCGAKSCPPIKTYTAEGLDEQLHLAAEAFLEGEDGMTVNMDKKEIKLSQIFKWYKEDFGSNTEQVLEFLHKLMGNGEKKSQLKELLTGKKYKVSYLHYDWGVNS